MNTQRTLIGKGRISTIYTDGTYAYKTYPNDFPTNWIHYEYDIHQRIKHQTTLPMVSYHLSENEREIQMDYVKGITLADRMRKEKYKQGLDDMISLQCTLYQYTVSGLPNAFKAFKETIESSIWDERLKQCALNSLNKIEPMAVLCHLDFHLENILFDGSKYIIIDWVNAKAGNPVMDIARSYIILKQYATRLSNKYLNLICQKLNIPIQSVMNAVPLMAYLRLLENGDSPFNETLIELIQEANHG